MGIVQWCLEARGGVWETSQVGGRKGVGIPPYFFTLPGSGCPERSPPVVDRREISDGAVGVGVGRLEVTAVTASSGGPRRHRRDALGRLPT